MRSAEYEAAPAAEMRPGGEDGLQVRQRAELLRLKGFQQTQVIDPSTRAGGMDVGEGVAWCS